jgi:transposase InsO family protein
MALKVITLSQLKLEILMAPDRHGLTVAETCRRYGISRQTFYDYRRRYRTEGLAGLEPRSQRPHGCPHQSRPEVEAMIVALRRERPRWGARKLRAALLREGASPPAVSTIHQILRRHGLIGDPARRRRAKALRRFVRPVPNDLWQIDATELRLADGTKAWVVDVLDDHARLALAATACLRATTTVAWQTVKEAIGTYGPPRQVLSDNGLAFSGRRHGRSVLFERELRALGIQPLTAKPRHPQTCGKLERFHQTLKAYLADHGPATSVEELQALLDAFRWHYNVERPHQALADRTPAEQYAATPPASPLQVGERTGPVVPRTLHPNKQGTISYRKRKIGVGAAWAGKPVQVVEDDGIVQVYDGHELIRELLLGPKGTYHPSGRPRGRPRKTPDQPDPVVSGMSP